MTDDTSGVGPAREYNYGIIPNGQFHIIAPIAFDSAAGSATQFSHGDTELGLKYRLVQEDKTIGGKIRPVSTSAAFYDINEHNHLLFLAGPALQNASATNLNSWYLGYRVTGP